MSERTPDLVVDSVTGVEVSLPVAGPGARAFAFLVDWHIRVVLALAWYVVAALLYNGRLSLLAPLNGSAAWYVFVVTPPVAVYFLYHYVLEIAMHGRTPGKRMAAIHIVGRDGGAPSVGVLLTRNVFRLVDSLPLFYGVGLVATMFTRAHVRIGDMAAGTLLVYDHSDVRILEHVSTRSLGGRLDAASAEIVNELLRRWTTLDIEARRRLARQVLARFDGGRTSSAATSPGQDTNVVAGGGAPGTGDEDATLRMQLEQLARD